MFSAHSLRLWAAQMGLLLLPKTNELLLLTPYFAGTQYRAYPLEKWALSHELCQHTPVALDVPKLRALDELVTLDGEKSASRFISVCQNTAAWLVENVTKPRSQVTTMEPGSNNFLPTWLVVAQHLQHTGSYFVQPATWFTLCTEWLSQLPESIPWLSDFSDWVRFAPSQEHRCALILTGLVCPM